MPMLSQLNYFQSSFTVHVILYINSSSVGYYVILYLNVYITYFKTLFSNFVKEKKNKWVYIGYTHPTDSLHVITVKSVEDNNNFKCFILTLFASLNCPVTVHILSKNICIFTFPMHKKRTRKQNQIVEQFNEHHI